MQTMDRPCARHAHAARPPRRDAPRNYNVSEPNKPPDGCLVLERFLCVQPTHTISTAGNAASQAAAAATTASAMTYCCILVRLTQASSINRGVVYEQHGKQSRVHDVWRRRNLRRLALSLELHLILRCNVVIIKSTRFARSWLVVASARTACSSPTCTCAFEVETIEHLFH